ncbi:MAG: hypothetical protein CSA20_03360 [Deltaproteobacteria bacterium]|nr:MAG: hypothetical protein CSB23_02650 [Deltaproteobacteria bacterium]PIE73138.1 MAG: hypothetical protein CSA20_03360 [Deltaproteobacteria bacterium]
MNLKKGITTKFLIWFLSFFLIYFGTVLVLYFNVHQMMSISETITGRYDKISQIARQMFENLLAMEENEKKYLLLKNDQYRSQFIQAFDQLQQGLAEVMALQSPNVTVSSRWQELAERYQRLEISIESSADIANGLWIPEEELDTWRNYVAQARTENEKAIELANRDLNRRGVLTVRASMVGLGLSVLVGLAGIFFVAYSMIRPLGKLIQGIRSISHERPGKPIAVNSQDEFGQLAVAYNAMSFRLREEQAMRTDFISMLSHEIRTPLTSIRESVSLIGEGIMGDVNPMQKKFLHIADAEIGRVCTLLNRMMQVSYLESVVLDLHKQPLAITPFMTGIFDSFHPMAREKNIRLDIHIPEKIPDIYADEKYLRQVVFNLVENAIKFSPKDSTVQCKIRRDPEEDTFICEILDTGPGILIEEKSLIFNRYYRGKNIREQTDGTGLGLSIAKYIVEAHGGTIEVSNLQQGGACFSFFIPFAR